MLLGFLGSRGCRQVGDTGLSYWAFRAVIGCRLWGFRVQHLEFTHSSAEFGSLVPDISPPTPSDPMAFGNYFADRFLSVVVFVYTKTPALVVFECTEHAARPKLKR